MTDRVVQQHLPELASGTGSATGRYGFMPVRYRLMLALLLAVAMGHAMGRLL